MRTRLAATLAAASLAACAADVPADEAATTRDRLAEPTAFALVPEGATGRMLSEWEHGQGRLEPKELRATDGILVLVADPRGAISVEELSVSFDDVRIGDEYFDEDFLIYHEDVDLCWRMRLRGWRILYAAAAVALHGRGFGGDRPRATVSRFVRRHAYRNHYLRLVKNLLPAQVWRDGLHLAAWEFVRAGFAVLREPFLLLAWRDLLRLLPRALRKRRLIMSRKRVGYREMAHWFL